jgi:small subunit ribosomal protein S3
MGQKVHPKIFRTGESQIYTWDSKWFSKKDFREYLKQDIQIRNFLKKELKDSGVAKIEIERSGNSLTVIIHSSKPGVIIGRAGTGAEELKKKIKAKFLNKKINFNLNILEVSKPSLNAEIILQNMIVDIEKRVPYRRVIKQTLSRVEKAGAEGAKIIISGRLDGAEIARDESLSWGKIPLHTLRADIDYASGTAHTIYGSVGLKIWVYRGEVFK